MQTWQLSIHAYDRPGSLERILRVMRHRGCKIINLNMQSHAQAQLILSVALADVKSKQQIHDQLIKLVDIIAIN